MLWDYTSGLQSSKNFERLLDRLDENTPAIEDFDMFGVQPALDFTVGLHCTIHCAMKASLHETIDEAASALTLSLNTIGKLIKYTEAPGLNGTELTQYIEEHELFGMHLSFIQELIDRVSQKKNQTRAVTRELRLFSANNGISQLGISLE